MHQIAPFQKILGGSMPPNPPSKRLATSRVASRFAHDVTRPVPQKVGPPWQILHTPMDYY